ncbi:Hypp9454 [Branchiostoma lanceolatum]|uniref:Hypp9454 protein n=1 Tax=Branchiostoma lanceolatum TaxID=7740 RepID=A0A8S4MNE9_BRALA|nr:Hypp9454 [Branchiostoma lanceolatum]
MEDADVVLFYGPPLVGKSSHYKQHLSSSHVRLSAQELFQEDQTLSLRQVAMRAVGLLREGKKVVIDDENWSRNTRMSYIKLISCKTPGKSIRCLKFHPQDKLQLNWAREWATLGAKGQGPQVNWKQVDAKIDAWFDENCWQRGVERPVPPAEAEGLSIDEVYTQLACQTHYKFEVPCLLVQWEAMVQSTGGRLVLRDSLLDVLQLWTEANPCGHIVVIVDGQNNLSGTHGSTSSQQTIHLKSVMTSLCQEFTENVLYFAQIADAGSSGLFSRPPEPGLLAWLQLRHHLNLFHQSSLYIWQSSNHRRSAEAVGMRNINGDRLVARPRMVLLVPKSMNAETPATLQSMKLVTPDTPAPPPSIPLYQEALKHCELGEGTSSTPQVCYITKNMEGCGRVHGVCFKDVSVLEKVQGLYRDNASMLAEPRSKIDEMCGRPVVIQPKTDHQENRQETSTSTINENRIAPLASSSSKTKRTIPAWMLPKTERKRSPEDAEIKELSISPRKKKRKSSTQANRIEYCMSEAELVQMAEQMLQKAGDQSFNDRQEEEDIFQTYQNHGESSERETKKDASEEGDCVTEGIKDDAKVKDETSTEVKVDMEVTQLLDDIFTTGRRKRMLRNSKPIRTRNVESKSRGQENEISPEAQETLSGVQERTDQEARITARNGDLRTSPFSRSADQKITTVKKKTATDTDFSFLDSIFGEKRVEKKEESVQHRYGVEDVSEEPFLDSIIYSKRREWRTDSSVVDSERDTSHSSGGNPIVCNDRSPWKKNPKTQQESKHVQSIDRLSFLDSIVSGKRKGKSLTWN